MDPATPDAATTTWQTDQPPAGPPPMSPSWGPPHDRASAGEPANPTPTAAPRRRWARTSAAVLGIAMLSMGTGAFGASLVVDRDVGDGANEVAIDNVGVDSAASGLSVAEIVNGLADSVVSIETTVSFRRGPFEAEG
ncbi:MAG TPA: hypothetical protein VF065_01685, partial [Ilumatobacter sp.]